MNKERLNEVKERSTGIYSFEEEDIVGVDVKLDDYEWLIEQAERVQELESEYKVRQVEYLEEHIDRLEQQNKRYRELIKKMKRMVYDPDVDCGIICTEIIEMEESE